MDFGVLHPGEMGAGIARTLVDAGHLVWWLPEGRSEATVERAERARLSAAGSMGELVGRCEVILSICPPHAAVDVAREVAASSTALRGIYLDANAVAPATALEVASIVVSRGARYVDGGIIGSPPPRGDTHLYLSGAAAPEVIGRCGAVALKMVALGDSPNAASALKMAYATWTKGSAALLLAIRAMASAYGVEAALVAEWEQSQTELAARGDRAAQSAMANGWRWSGEMEEVGAAFAGVDLPDGFGRAAAEIYRRVPRRRPAGEGRDLPVVLRDLNGVASVDPS